MFRRDRARKCVRQPILNLAAKYICFYARLLDSKPIIKSIRRNWSTGFRFAIFPAGGRDRLKIDVPWNQLFGTRQSVEENGFAAVVRPGQHGNAWVKFERVVAVKWAEVADGDGFYFHVG